MYNTLRMCQSASLSVLPSCQHTSGLPSQPHSVLGHCDTSQRDVSEKWLVRFPSLVRKKSMVRPMLCGHSGRLEERKPLGKTWKVKIVETFLSWIQKWLHESEPRYAVGWQVPLGRIETDLSVFFLTLYIWGLITIIAACIKLNKTLFIILKFMTGGKFLMPNPRESHFIYDLLNYNIMDYEKCSLHISFVYNENT